MNLRYSHVVFGNLTVNVVGLFLTEIFPLCCSLIFLHLAKPNPVPFCLIVKSDSNILSMNSLGMPTPENRNERYFFQSLENLMAFS